MAVTKQVLNFPPSGPLEGVFMPIDTPRPPTCTPGNPGQPHHREPMNKWMAKWTTGDGIPPPHSDILPFAMALPLDSTESDSQFPSVLTFCSHSISSRDRRFPESVCHLHNSGTSAVLIATKLCWISTRKFHFLLSKCTQRFTGNRRATEPTCSRVLQGSPGASPWLGGRQGAAACAPEGALYPRMPGI